MNAPLQTVPHEAILASAGSGKTFQLAHRYIRLLAHDVEPSRIIAVTFSRKAAGEIFTAIVTHLREAATSEKNAAATAERIQRPELRATDFLRLLRRFLNDLQRLHISTIDSFTIGILRTFPLELGIAPGFQVMNGDSPQAVRARTDTLSALFRATGRDAGDRQELLEAFKQATPGQEVKRFAATFDRVITDHLSLYRELPDVTAWGRPERIWPDGNPWLTAPAGVADAVKLLRSEIASGEWNAYAQDKWTLFLDEIESYHPGLPWDRIAYMADRLLAESDALRQGRIDLKIYRSTYTRTGRVADAMYVLVRHLMYQSLQAALERTQGIGRLLDRFEQHYDRQVRRPGLISFEDSLHLILEAGKPLSRSSGDPARLHIDYRLDSQLDHWLMDEFQDTSDLQWAVLRNLADEILQDSEGARSFFFVGDVKQAIYGWRGGNHKLFGRILERYGARIEQRPLNTSFRSSPEVLDLVNETFAELPDEIPAAVQEQWAAFWSPHQCRQDQPPPTGHAALLEAGTDLKDRDAVYQACADLLGEIDPLRRGMTVAVLVRQNKTAQAVANALRAALPRMPVAIEGESELADNPVVLLLLALVQFAAHPGDTLAREHLRMSPLAHAVAHAVREPVLLLTDIYRHGYAAFLCAWGRKLEAATPLDAFGRHRLQALLDAAAEFDTVGNRQPDDFLAFIRAYRFPEQTADSTVRVMTIHKSKGLGFDVVLLPELTGSLGGSLRHDLHLARDESGDPQWALALPNAPIRDQDDVLQAETQHALEDDGFENLCALYVALTRAKRGLYLITTPPPKSTGALTLAAYLRLQLAGDKGATPTGTMDLNGRSYGVLYERGQRDGWAKAAPSSADPGEPAIHWPEQFASRPSKRRRLLPVSPSSQAEVPRAAHLLFAPAVHRSLDLGRQVHALFEQVDWTDTADVAQVVAAARRHLPGLDDEAVTHFETALATPAFQSALARPDGAATLWREQPFEAVIHDEWVTGLFDRVVLVRDPSGVLTAAEILDYKTNVVDEQNLADTVAHYRPQLTLYARALSQLTGFPYERIRRTLLFTRTGQAIAVEPC